MKKLVILLIVCLIGTIGFAQNKNKKSQPANGTACSLLIQTVGQEPFTIYLDGKRQNRKPQLEVRIDNLKKQSYEVKAEVKHADKSKHYATATIVPQGKDDLYYVTFRESDGQVRILSVNDFRAQTSPQHQAKPKGPTTQSRRKQMHKNMQPGQEEVKH